MRKGPVLRWLGIIGGGLAILTFLGIANYRQLSSALGWHDSPTDAAVCESAQTDVAKVNLDAPAGFVAKVGFYERQIVALDTLRDKAQNSTLRDYLSAVGTTLTRLVNDWGYLMIGVGGTGRNEPQSIGNTTASLSRSEKTLESWCIANTGVS